MIKKRLIQNSKQVHIVFTVVFILLVLSYTTIIIYLKGWDFTILGLSSLFMFCMIGLGSTWVLLFRRQITAYIDNVDAMVEGAIQGQEPITIYEETALSSLEHKLIRYIEMSTASERNIELEKNKIKVLLSDISHQTKTPLSNIMLYSQLLEEAPGLNEDSRQSIHHIKEQSNKLSWLIQSLIKLSRLETGTITLHIKDNPVVQTIQQTVSQIYAQAERKNINISITCDPAIVARHDMKWTSEALFNLLENAVKYTESGGKILLSVQSNEMFTRIDILDTGMGIAANELHSVFKRFYRGQNVREVEGVGIGLFLAREIITSQGGYIQVTSELHKGSLFSVFLPRT